MLRLLLLLLVGAAFAQESGDFALENSDELIKAVNDEDEKLDEAFDDAYDEEDEKTDEKDLSLSQEIDHIEPDFTEKTEGDLCINKDTCGTYHVFLRPTRFFRAQRICRCKGGSLSSIHNCKTNNFLRILMTRTCRNVSFAWIGVWKRNRRSRFCNIDGSKLDYTNWGCEKRRCRPRRRWCVAMNVRTGKWRALRCNVRLPFICSY
ncbi:bone marrow proteoglycan-like [Hyla sarda]|uniref:bone marrow proteoglycan-like n=1 Tax=Hyla sarda TaxID=327740 RepID=UPI0024C45A10|nr:bone marrow proteoglycan-like [Hyla sarda]XP_056387721.1 bone marrow proteoglycan-like [Hyla sarda]